MFLKRRYLKQIMLGVFVVAVVIAWINILAADTIAVDIPSFIRREIADKRRDLKVKGEVIEGRHPVASPRQKHADSARIAPKEVRLGDVKDGKGAESTGEVIKGRGPAGNKPALLKVPDDREKSGLPFCDDKPPGLVWKKNNTVNLKDLPYFELNAKFSFLKPGGNYSPSKCRAFQRLAVIIPYRNREEHLRVLLNNLVPFLVRQEASFAIFVIEQVQKTQFNRALLLNVGVVEALKRDEFTCFIFHDVDLIPMNDRNLYRCSSNPKHLAVAIEKNNYRLPYLRYFGGVVAMSRDQVFAINGHSNLYFGWGGEDDDLYKRIKQCCLIES